jgi:bacillithiol system protein YtxJ
MNWKNLNSPDTLNELFDASHSQPQIVFKHSPRCGISLEALYRTEQNWQELTERGQPWLLNVLEARPASNELSERTGVMHQSPQVLIIWKGECVFHRSHQAIQVAQFPRFTEAGE